MLKLEAFAQPERSRWYLIHTKPGEDARALRNLERQRFECYWPVRQVPRQRRGRQCSIMEPLFPRYLFVRLDCLHDDWSCVRSTRGVRQIVRFNTYPLPVQVEVIDAIRTRLASNAESQALFKPGETVRIMEGPFANLEAILLANDGNDRVMLLLNILQTNQQLSFPLKSVCAVA